MWLYQSSILKYFCLHSFKSIKLEFPGFWLAVRYRRRHSDWLNYSHLTGYQIKIKLICIKISRSRIGLNIPNIQKFSPLRPNLKSLNRVIDPPKPGSNWAPAQSSKHWIQFQEEPTMFQPRLNFLKLGLW